MYFVSMETQTIITPQLVNNETYLDPKIWGPHFWFTLQTIALQYPNKPNDVIKKKYYRLLTDLQDFLPNMAVKKQYSDFLREYPVSPYLDSRLSLLKWINFIHNKYNVLFEKEPIEFYKGLELYYETYKTEEFQKFRMKKLREKYILGGMVGVLIALGIYMYRA
jgi:hypothetical protein